MFNINTTCNVVLSVAPQTQQFVTQSLETLKSFLMLYTSTDLADLADLKSRIDRSHARLDLAQKRLDQVDSHLQHQQKASA